jgi:TonB family protein
MPPNGESVGPEIAGSTRPNPVALEALVSVTGARPSGSAGSRDLFTEDTSTVLVFADGAVIRLSAAVSVGQLLFVTNKKSNQEVVCQVLHKRSFKPTICYVELQFTEEQPDFWGVAFPEGQQGDAELGVVEQVQAEEMTGDDPRTPVELHKKEDVEQLKQEVEALRAQLKALEKKKEEQAAKPGAEPAAGEESARDFAAVEAAARRAAEEEAAARAAEVAAKKARVAQEEAEAERAAAAAKNETRAPVEEKPAIEAKHEAAALGELKKVEAPARVTPETKPEFERIPDRQRIAASPEKLELASVNDPSPEVAAKPEVQAPLMPTATDRKESTRAVIGMALPIRKSEKPTQETKDPVEDLLPKPELDFSRMPQSAAYLDENHPDSIYKKFDAKAERIRIMAMSALLVVLLIGGAWYGKWWQYVPKRKTLVAAAPAKAAKSNVVPTAAPTASVPAGSLPDVSTALAKDAAAPANDAGAIPIAGASSGETGKRETLDAPAEVRNKASAEATGAPVVTAKKSVLPKEKPAGKIVSAKKSVAAGAGADANADEPVASDAPLEPPKLLKASTPVYPPEAMLNYITGDVRAEVVVDATGHVGDVKVISGPRALREAAVEALKQYEYAPATQGGRTVSSRTVVVVKFWFNP